MHTSVHVLACHFLFVVGIFSSPLHLCSLPQHPNAASTDSSLSVLYGRRGNEVNKASKTRGHVSLLWPTIFLWALGNAPPELLERPGVQKFLSVTLFKQTFVIYLTVFCAPLLDFSFSIRSPPSVLLSRPPSGITVDGNLAPVFIFLSSTDNDHGTEATERLWEDGHRHTHRKEKQSQRIRGYTQR